MKNLGREGTPLEFFTSKNTQPRFDLLQTHMNYGSVYYCGKLKIKYWSLYVPF